MQQIDYEIHRRNRRLGYAMDNVLEGCKLLLEELKSEHYDSEERIHAMAAINGIDQLMADSKKIESCLLAIGNIYVHLIPKNTEAEE